MNPLVLIPLPYRILALALLAAALWGHGYVKGVSGESGRQEAAAASAQAAEWDRHTQALARGQAAVRAAQQAKLGRDTVHRNLRQEISHAQNRDLAVPECPSLPSPLPAGERGRGEGSQDRPAYRVTRYFVGLWDGAWTDPLGQPLFGDPPGAAAEGAQPSAAGPRELLENHRDNAALCTEDRDRLDRLIELIEELEREWGRNAPAGK